MDQIKPSTWHNAFGDVPDRFSAHVQAVVQKMEREKPCIRYKLIPIFVLFSLLLAATALALNNPALLQTLAGNLRSFLQPEAATLVTQNVHQTGGTLPNASFTVEEAIYDGRQIYVVIRVHAKDPGMHLLMDSTARPADGMDWWKDFDMEAGQTYSYHAHVTKRDILQAEIDIDANASSRTQIWDKGISYDGEDILYTLTLSADGTAEAAPAFSISTYNVYRGDLSHEERLQRGSLTFTVPVSNACTAFTAQTPINMPLSGMTLEGLILEQSPVATYISAIYKLNINATDKQIINYKDGIWFRWMDVNENPILEGNSQFSLALGSDDTLELTAAYRAFESIPGCITLEFFNGMTKERFDTLHITLTRQGGTNR